MPARPGRGGGLRHGGAGGPSHAGRGGARAARGRRAAPVRELVLIGGGHAHVQVLRRLAMRPLPDVRVWVVLDRPEAVYSGMVPAFVAGTCRAPELEIDVWPLARRAGATVVHAPALALDPQARRIALEGRPPLAWDVASLDVGSSVRGLDLPGVAEHALATRPIRGLVDRLDAELARLRAATAPVRVLVVGGGAAGLELLFTLEARLRRELGGGRARLLLASDEAALLPGASRRLAAAAAREASRRGLEIRLGARIAAVEKDGARTAGPDGPGWIPADLVVWAAGAAPPPLLARSPLPRSAEGFVRVEETLQVVGHPDLFAAGDCALLETHPWMPRAGVHAVREGPVLARNLAAHLRGRRLVRHRPQRDFLSLLNLGGGRALGGKWGVVASGAPVARLKDAIDRRFVRRFQVLDEEGRPGPGLPPPEAMPRGEGAAERIRALRARMRHALGLAGARRPVRSTEDAAAGAIPEPEPAEGMACGGCAAKLGPAPLARALGRLAPAPPDPDVTLGLAEADDAAALRLPDGTQLLASIDGFRAFCGDPFLVGRVAAQNALSDVWATGGTPRHALALVTLPEDEPERAEERCVQLLAGVRAGLDPHGVTLLGGHTTLGAELFVALAVTGRLGADGAPLRLRGARPGDRLLLSKPLGTGVLLAADAMGRARGAWMEAAHAALLRPNAAAARVARAFGARAGTDVTGFGLAGHLAELLGASGAGARLALADLPALPGARELLAAGVRSSFHPRARPRRAGAAAGAADAAGAEVPRSAVAVPEALRGRPELELLFDPQTAGGLLLAVPAARAGQALAALREGGDPGAAEIGVVTAPPPGSAGPRAAPIVLEPGPLRPSAGGGSGAAPAAPGRPR